MWMEVDTERCNGCGKCADVCPKKAVVLKDRMYARGLGVYKLPFNVPVDIVQRAEISRAQCDGCGECIRVCEPKAIVVHGKKAKKKET